MRLRPGHHYTITVESAKGARVFENVRDAGLIDLWSADAAPGEDDWRQLHVFYDPTASPTERIVAVPPESLIKAQPTTE